MYESVVADMRERPRRWLVTGAAGFIGSNLVERLLTLGQTVVGLDNFSTGRRRNLEDVRQRVDEEQWGRLRFVEGDICDPRASRKACEGVELVLHQAALGSVPRSLDNPAATHRTNTDGFLEMLIAARDAGVERFVYASSSSVYGDHPGLPKVEERIGKPLSPYAVTKRVNELYASVFHGSYGMETVGLRYFNVFGRRQDPDGPYAAVIPRWVGRLLAGQPCQIFGDGETSRDFCYVENVIEANVLAAVAPAERAAGEVFNVACGGRITLNELFEMIRDGLAGLGAPVGDATPERLPFRAGDVRHSQADVTRARERLGYDPAWSVDEGLRDALAWYATQMGGCQVAA